MTPVSITPVQQRCVVLVTPDADLRERLSQHLSSMRWVVRCASGGAEAMAYLEETAPEAMIIDHWLPDLDAAEFTEQAAVQCPGTDFLQMDGSAFPTGGRSARRNELLHALRESQKDPCPVSSTSTPHAHVAQTVAITPAAPHRLTMSSVNACAPESSNRWDGSAWTGAHAVIPKPSAQMLPFQAAARGCHPAAPDVEGKQPVEIRMHLPDMVGDSPDMRELNQMVRLVAPHTTTVLIQGETGTGKELVAKAVHRLGARAAKPFVILNCAAIPEHLLEAELFGHTRGAFTGAVTSRTGRIEAAHGGTLFLDEIGEMPLALQAKLLRFLESGEIQRVGDNDISRVDVRIVAATHQPLEANAEQKLFRLDLYHRLAVFPVDVPTLRSRYEDIPMLVEYFLTKLAVNAPRCSIGEEALAVLSDYPWYGNVRELGHVLQRAVILAGDSPVILPQHLRLRPGPRSALPTDANFHCATG